MIMVLGPHKKKAEAKAEARAAKAARATGHGELDEHDRRTYHEEHDEAASELAPAVDDTETTED